MHILMKKQKITLVEGTADGTVKFKGTDVPVHGVVLLIQMQQLMMLAADEALRTAQGDATTKANTAKSEAIAEATTLASTAETNAKTYTDNALTWGTIA